VGAGQTSIDSSCEKISDTQASKFAGNLGNLTGLQNLSLRFNG